MRPDAPSLAAAVLFAAGAYAADESFEACLKAVLSTHPGRIVKVEMKTENSARVYEFDVRADDHADWDIECTAESGQITEVEREVNSPSDPLFAAKRKIDEAKATELALKAYPGDVKEIEYEIESNGEASYEFDILTRDGREMKVEVDAASGRIVEADPEFWQVGIE
jgi:uncharacterized membrane protein YkoI